MLKIGDMVLATMALAKDHSVGSGHLLFVIGVSEEGVVMQPLFDGG